MFSFRLHVWLTNMYVHQLRNIYLMSSIMFSFRLHFIVVKTSSVSMFDEIWYKGSDRLCAFKWRTGTKLWRGVWIVKFHSAATPPQHFDDKEVWPTVVTVSWSKFGKVKLKLKVIVVSWQFHYQFHYQGLYNRINLLQIWISYGLYSTIVGFTIWYIFAPNKISFIVADMFIMSVVKLNLSVFLFRFMHMNIWLIMSVTFTCS